MKDKDLRKRLEQAEIISTDDDMIFTGKHLDHMHDEITYLRMTVMQTCGISGTKSVSRIEVNKNAIEGLAQKLDALAKHLGLKFELQPKQKATWTVTDKIGD